MNRKIVAIIVTYNPDLFRLKENILALNKQLDNILIFDNNSLNIREIKELIKINNNIILIENPKNQGVAVALHYGISYAKLNNFEWLLTLDQDSIINENLIYEYSNYLDNIGNNQKEIGILCCNIFDENRHIKKQVLKNRSIDVNVCITSGSLMNVEATFSVGNFNEKLFIDYVDFEICLRLKKNNYRIVQLLNTNIFHQLGDINNYKIGPLDIVITNHSPLRRYYMFRNKIYIYKSFYKYFPKFILQDVLSSLKLLILILFFEEYKLAKIKCITRGIIDGIKNKY